MSFMDIFRNLFGLKRDDPTPRTEDPNENRFRKPIWVNNDDDDDDEYNSDFSKHQRGENINFEIFIDPFEMSHFESQIDNVMKRFFGAFSGQTGGFFTPFDNDSTLEFGLPSPPRYSKRSENSLRDQCLLREIDSPDDIQNHVKSNQDLDGKIDKESLLKFWHDPKNQQIEPVNEPQKLHEKFFTGAVSSTQIITRSDGTVEKHQTFKDNDGNKRTIVRRQIGDKIHELITNQNKDGIETKTENFINMDENEIKTFNDKWKSDSGQNQQIDFGPRNSFPWHQFFGPGAKL